MYPLSFLSLSLSLFSFSSFFSPFSLASYFRCKIHVDTLRMRASEGTNYDRQLPRWNVTFANIFWFECRQPLKVLYTQTFFFLLLCSFLFPIKLEHKHFQSSIERWNGTVRNIIYGNLGGDSWERWTDKLIISTYDNFLSQLSFFYNRYYTTDIIPTCICFLLHLFYSYLYTLFSLICNL